MRKRPKLTAQQHRALAYIETCSSKWVCGIDEVGRGCFAGPIVVGGVVFPKGFDHEQIDDSKKLSHKKRVEVLHDVILPNALATAVLSFPASYIDQIGVGVAQDYLTEGVGLYMRTRFKKCLIVQDGSEPVPVDGKERVISLTKADALVPAVAAASILAKVNRDKHMLKASEYYPGYGFERNKGYHSEEHMSGLRQYGACLLHRKSWKPIRPFC